MAWSDATLEYLHDLSCEDPLTGLASLAHVRTRLDEIYREAELTDVGVAGSHALVIVELCFREPTAAAGPPLHPGAAAGPGDRGASAPSTPAGRRSAGSAWTGPWPWSPRTVDLGTLGGAAAGVPRDLDLGEVDVRVWIEGLPRVGGVRHAAPRSRELAR